MSDYAASRKKRSMSLTKYRDSSLNFYPVQSELILAMSGKYIDTGKY
jgi:hypothetical protein